MAMSILIFTDVLCSENVTEREDGILLDFRPFRRNSVNEVDARKIQKSLPKDRYRWGIFDVPLLRQLLYLFSEDLINGALLSRISEKDLFRLSESFACPIFIEGTCQAAETIQKEQRLPINGHFFGNIPEEDVLSILNKPYILSMQAIDNTNEPAALLQKHPPFALWCGKPAEAERAKVWIHKFDETRLT